MRAKDGDLAWAVAATDWLRSHLNAVRSAG
jgi:hypothetical protein